MAEEQVNKEENSKEKEESQKKSPDETISDENSEKKPDAETKMVEKDDSSKNEDSELKTEDSDVDPKSENEDSEEDPEDSEEKEIAPPMDSYPVLIIDDDRWLQRIFSQYLKSWGFNHIQAMNSFEGVDKAIKHKPLLIFLDIIMPDVTGDITLKFLKGIEFLKDVPIVIISGNLNKEVLKTTYKDGAAGFISKPFTKDILYSKIKDVLDPKIFRRMVKDGHIELQLAKKVHLTGM